MTEETTNPRATMGDNRPPISIDDLPDLLEPFELAEIAARIPDVHESDVAVLLSRMKDIASDASVWLDLGKIEDEATAAIAADQIAAMRKLKKDVAVAQKASKAIWANKAAAAFDRFAKILTGLDRGLDKMLDMQTGYLRIREQERQAEAKRLADEAAKKAEEAAEALRLAERNNDLMGMADAEALQKEAAKAEKTAQRADKAPINVGSATGAGRTVSLRKVKVATITNFMATLLHYKDNEKLREAVQDIVNAEVRAASFNPEKNSIPGVTVTTEDKAV